MLLTKIAWKWGAIFVNNCLQVMRRVALVRLEKVKRFQTVQAFVQRFTGGGREVRCFGGVGARAAWAGYVLRGKSA